MLTTPKKGGEENFEVDFQVLAEHSRQRALNRNKLMILPHSEDIFESFFERQPLAKPPSSIQGIFGEGEERQVSDICYSFIGFNDFM